MHHVFALIAALTGAFHARLRQAMFALAALAGLAFGSTPAPSTVNAGTTFFQWNFVIHKWLGLFAALWLAVLGLTGFFLDHPTWRWQVQAKAPTWLTTQALEKNSSRNLLRFLQVDPRDSSIRVAGGPRGLWFTRDSGATWLATSFPKGDHPQTLAIEPDAALGWQRLWLATDDGVYLSEDAGQSARATALQGELITSLAAGAEADEMMGVIDKSQVFRFKSNAPENVTHLNLAPLNVQARPESVQVIRFMRELHFGTGVTDSLTSLVMNDLGGVGMFILSITGLLYWALPKYWKVQGKSRSKRAAGVKSAKAATKKATILWLFRTHSITMGITSVLMLIYLSITGIFVGHGKELGDWMRKTRIAQIYLTPAFALKSWDGRIDAIVAYPGRPESLSIGSRYGLFTTADGGKNWTREVDATGEPMASAARLRRLGDAVLIPNGMAGPSMIRDADSVNHEVGASEEHARHSDKSQRARAPTEGETSEMGSMGNMFMPSDVTRIGDKFAWKTSSKLLVTDGDGHEIEKLDIKQPMDAGVPWFTWFLRVHMGTIFWSEWRWINDLFSVVAVFLSVTGLVRWWRKKWA